MVGCQARGNCLVSFRQSAIAVAVRVTRSQPSAWKFHRSKTNKLTEQTGLRHKNRNEMRDLCQAPTVFISAKRPSGKHFKNREFLVVRRLLLKANKTFRKPNRLPKCFVPFRTPGNARSPQTEQT